MKVEILKFFQITIIALFVTIIGAPIAFVPIVLFYLPLWACVVILAKFFRPDLDGPVTSFNTMFQLHKVNINCIGCIAWNGQIKTEEFIKATQDQALSLRKPNGQLVYHALKKSYTNFLGYAFWKKDTHFNLQNHIRDYDHTGELELPSTVDEESLQRILKGLLKVPWKEGQSPWEFLIIHNFQHEGKSVTMMLVRYDHVLADGYSMIQFYRKILLCVAPVPEFNISSSKPVTFAQRLALILKIPYDSGKVILDAMTASKLCHQKQISNPGVIVGFTRKIDVQTIKQIKNHFKVSYGAVIFSVYLGALERALRSCGQFVPDNIATNFLLPKLNHPGGLCNHTHSMIATWPLKRPTLDRLLQVQKAFVSLSQSSATYAFDFLIFAGSFYPTIVRTAVSRLTYMIVNQSIYLTTMPVTTAPDCFAGFETIELIPINDTLSSIGVGMGLTTGGCNNKFRFSYTINEGFFTSDDAALNMARYVEQELQVLVDAVTKSL